MTDCVPAYAYSEFAGRLQLVQLRPISSAYVVLPCGHLIGHEKPRELGTSIVHTYKATDN